MVLYTGKHSQFTFNTHASRMSIFHDFPRQLDVVVKRKGRAVYHD